MKARPLLPQVELPLATPAGRRVFQKLLPLVMATISAPTWSQATPGMLEEIAQRYNADLTDVPVIGDSLRDLQSAVAVGAQPILVLTGKGKKTRNDPDLPAITPVFENLAAAVDHLTQQ